MLNIIHRFVASATSFVAHLSANLGPSHESYELVPLRVKVAPTGQRPGFPPRLPRR